MVAKLPYRYLLFLGNIPNHPSQNRRLRDVDGALRHHRHKISIAQSRGQICRPYIAAKTLLAARPRSSKVARISCKTPPNLRLAGVFRRSIETANDFRNPAILLSGPVDYDMYATFRNALMNAPLAGLVVIELSTLGGDPEVARMLKRRFENVITYLRHRITNARSESINAKIQWVKYTARGYRNKQNFIHAIYFHCGGLDLVPEATK